MLGVVCSAAYLALGQRAIHGEDAYYLITYLAQGIEHSYHLLYLHLVALAVAPLEGAGVGLFEAVRACSALGAAGAVVWFWCAARRLGGGRAEALAVATMVAVAPGVVFFATIVEVHAVFLFFAGLASLAFAHAAARPRLVRVGLLGITTALAALVHASGHLLAPLFALWLWARGRTWRSHFGLAVAGLAAHGVVAALAASLLQPDRLAAPMGGQLEFLRGWIGDRVSVSHLPQTLVQEWLLPLGPAAWLCWAAVGRRGLRRALLAFTVAWCGYLVAASVILQQIVERGAYLLPLAFPAAWLTARSLRRSWVWGAIAVTAALAVHEVRMHDRPMVADEFGAGIAALNERQPVFVVCRAWGERRALLRAAPRVPFVSAATLLQHVEDQGLDAAAFSMYFDATVAGMQRAGRSVYLSDGARRLLRQTAALRAFATAHLPARFELEPVVRAGFRGVRLVPR